MGKYKKFTDEQIVEAWRNSDCDQNAGESLGISGWSFSLRRKRLKLEQKRKQGKQKQAKKKSADEKPAPKFRKMKKLVDLTEASEKLFKAAYATCKSVDDAAYAVHVNPLYLRRWMVQNGLSESGMNRHPEVVSRVASVSMPVGIAAGDSVPLGDDDYNIIDVLLTHQPDSFETELNKALAGIKHRILDGHNLHLRITGMMVS